MYRDYICDDCGFSSQEEEGVYLCPKCNNKMRIAKPVGAYGGGDNTRGHGKSALLLIIAIFGYGISLNIDWILGIIGIVVVTIILIVLWKSLNVSIRDQAIRVESKNVEAANYCANCGKRVPNGVNYCPKCGHEIIN